MFKILFKAVLGSRAYGTHTETSDYDYRGVGIQTSIDYYFGNKRLKQQRGTKEEDIVIYSLAEFFNFAAKGNPNILEILFQENKEQIEVNTPEWENLILPNRKLFLSKLAKDAYEGYAKAQYIRMENHHNFILNPPPKPEVDSFFYKPVEKWEEYKNIFIDYDTNKPEQRSRLINALDSISDTRILNTILIARIHGKNMSFVFKNSNTEKQGMIFDEDRYQKALKEYNSYTEKRENRNRDRYALEEKYGYDTKHASHTIRLLDQAEDLLLHHNIRLCREERVQLWRDIKNGKFSFEEFQVIYKEMLEKLELWAEQSTLPNKPDMNKIEDLLIEITKSIVDLT